MLIHSLRPLFYLDNLLHICIFTVSWFEQETIMKYIFIGNISRLTLNFQCSSDKRSGHIPYRDSKLTRILQLSLGGNARTAIICTMSPAQTHVEQSRNTLFFATCAKEVTNNAKVNMVRSVTVMHHLFTYENANLHPLGLGTYRWYQISNW